MKPWLLPSFCVALILLTLAGCSPYGPEKIRTRDKPPEMRDKQQILNECDAKFNDFENTIRNIRDAKAAKAATPAVAEFYNRQAALRLEATAVARDMSPDQAQQFKDQYKENVMQGDVSLKRAFEGMGKNVPDPPPEFLKARQEGIAVMQKAEADADAQDALPLPEILPETPKPPAFSWGTKLLCLLVLGACVGSLCRDGLWGNALRLVNVLFAGLLAMNFYEWVANWLTGGDKADWHPYVALFDFLSFWTCFIVVIVVFRAVTDAVSKVRVRFLQVVDRAGGVVLSICIGWVMVGLTLTSLHMAPLAQYPLLGSFQPSDGMFFGLAPDREWLGFTKYQSSGPYCRSVSDEQLDQCEFPPDFIEKQLMRRLHVEHYVLKKQSLLVNKP